MLQFAIGLFVLALIAGLFGFGIIASSFMAVAKIMFFVLIALAVVSFLFSGRLLRQWQG